MPVSTIREVPAQPLAQMDADIHRVFALQKVNARRLRTSTATQRIAKLQRLRAALLANRQAIVDAGARDFRRPAIEVEMFELMPVIVEIGDTCKHLKRWLKPRKVRPTAMTFGTRAWTRYEPRGRCLIIAPWNYPLTLTIGPLVPAIACGNTVMIKTSEIAPHFSALLARIIRETFAEDEVACFEGDASVASALLALPFDHIFFTGAPAIGKIVMSAAAQHLSSVTLELGGKCPVIVDASADIELAVNTIAWAKYANCGQTCIAPDHVYVHERVHEQFIERLKQRLDQLYGEGMQAKDAPLGRIINRRHSQRLMQLLDDARERGARVLYGGAIDLDANFVAPTLIADIPADARILAEEIFGPLLPIIGFAHINTVLDAINAAPKPLAVYIWSRDDRQIEHIITDTSAGGTCVNHQSIHFLHHNLPFGGVNNSGIGSYHGEWGIRAFSHERAIVQTQYMMAKIFFPPYNALTQRIVNFILKFM